ncbi:MAG: hypothetical protein D6715_02010 [Calditrichaeota bacterium]|nr:MAG: hypothetical protein D6715_02010 [Calditrichota bacterium]
MERFFAPWYAPGSRRAFLFQNAPSGLRKKYNLTEQQGIAQTKCKAGPVEKRMAAGQPAPEPQPFFGDMRPAAGG